MAWRDPAGCAAATPALARCCSGPVKACVRAGARSRARAFASDVQLQGECVRACVRASEREGMHAPELLCESACAYVRAGALACVRKSTVTFACVVTALLPACARAISQGTACDLACVRASACKPARVRACERVLVRACAGTARRRRRTEQSARVHKFASPIPTFGNNNCTILPGLLA